MSTNPYQTPEGQLTTDDQAVGEIKFFSPSSRVNRLRYWAHSMLFTFAMLGAFVVIGLVAAFVSTTLAIVLGVIAYIVMVVFSFILIIQRLHDLNKTGWMSLLAIVPLANIYLIVLLIFFKGTEGRNDYGLQTPPNKTWHWVMAFSFPVLMVVLGILAAISLPAYQSYLDAAQSADSSYTSPDSDTYPSEYTEDGAIEDTRFSDDAIEDGISYETPEEQAVDDDVVEDEEIDAAEAELMEEAGSPETEETPQ
ncbi:MAG: hypothetical protein K0Q67_106 [Cellvibrio sp.]|nr:hypothetical protein [Cellvibrio sp.]